MIGEAEEKTARSRSVEQFPQATGQWPVILLGRWQRRVAAPCQKLARRPPLAIFGWIEKPGFVVGHGSIVARRGRKKTAE
jgi:hypothetical protein